MIGWFRSATCVLVIAVLWLAGAAWMNEPRVRVMFVRPPAFVVSRDTVTYVVRVPRHTENRLLIVAAVAEDGIISEMRRELDGAQDQTLWNVRWQLPAGHLSLIAVVFDTRRRAWRAVHRLTVLE